MCPSEPSLGLPWTLSCPRVLLPTYLSIYLQARADAGVGWGWDGGCMLGGMGVAGWTPAGWDGGCRVGWGLQGGRLGGMGLLGGMGVACWVCRRRGCSLTETAAVCASKEKSSRSGESEHSTTRPLARPSAAKPSHVPMAQMGSAATKCCSSSSGTAGPSAAVLASSHCCCRSHHASSPSASSPSASSSALRTLRALPGFSSRPGFGFGFGFGLGVRG